MEKKKTNKNEPKPVEEWDLSEGMGILPQDISFTQNIGCVGGKSKTAGNKESTKPPIK